MEGKPPVDPAWRTGARIVALVAAIAAFWLAREAVLLAFLGILIGVVLSFPVDFLARHLKRGLAVLIVLAAMLGLAGVAIAFGAAKIAGEADTVREQVEKAMQTAREKFSQLRGEKSEQSVPPDAGEKAVKGAMGIVSGLTAAVLVIVLGLFLVNEPQTYRKGLRLLVPSRFEEPFETSYEKVSSGLRKWVGGILVSMTIMGTLTAIGLAIAGIKGWLVLGILTFLGTFVPYVGAIASAIPGLIVGAAQDTTHLFAAAGVYVGVHLVEGYLVQPLIMKRAVHLQPALLLTWQGVFGAIFGLAGTIVATPALVCVQILTRHLWVERRLGKQIT